MNEMIMEHIEQEISKTKHYQSETNKDLMMSFYTGKVEALEELKRYIEMYESIVSK